MNTSLIKLIGLALLLTACQAADIPQPLSTQPVVHTADWAVEWWGPRHEEKLWEKDQAETPIEIVLLGDSITHGWEDDGKAIWNKFFGNYTTLNLGFGGDRTEHVIWRLQNGAVDDISPELVVLMIGTNNTGHRMDTADDTVKGVQVILNELETRLPETDILLLATFPRAATADDPLRLRNAEIRDLLKTLPKNERVHYRDIGDVFLSEGGEISPSIMHDYLHLTPEGYTLWAEAIEADVKYFVEGSHNTENSALNDFHAEIETNFSGIPHLSAAEVQAMESDTLFFDVREEDEFAVSHIPGAVRVDPSLEADAFMTQFKQNWAGKTVVFYCSVGQRSSMMAARLEGELKAQGAAQVANLEKGVFGWHNEGLPLMDAAGPTEKVHPYDDYWGRMVNRQEKTAYTP